MYVVVDCLSSIAKQQSLSSGTRSSAVWQKFNYFLNSNNFREKPVSSNFRFEEVGCRYPPGYTGFHLGNKHFSYNRTRAHRPFC